MTVVMLVCLGSYLLGAIPFGYVVGRARGVNVMKEGSGNVGATNVARLCGLPWGILVFVLDFAKGAIPVYLASQLTPPSDVSLYPDTLPVVAGISAFLGHLFPIYLGFRGGKGVATGAGIIAVLVPLATVIVLAAWGVLLYLTRYVAVASMLAAGLLFVLRLVIYPAPWSDDHLVVTLFCMIGTLLVFLRHHSNVRRLLAGTEPRIGSRPRGEPLP